MTRRIGGSLATLGVGALLAFAPAARAAGERKVFLGSKACPESWILGDALTLLVRRGAGEAEHKKNLGGTEIAYQALRAGNIDAYPEYTGTIAEVILRVRTRPTLDEMRALLAPFEIGVSAPLGFNDGYALAVTAAARSRTGVRTISDLRSHSDLRAGLTHEFLGRADGYEGLARFYRLALAEVRGIQHELAYEAMAKGQIDLTDIYTTDPQIERLSLGLLVDDLSFFPRYDAVILYRRALSQEAPAALAAMTSLVGHVDERAMMRANAAVALDKHPSEDAARELVRGALGGRVEQNDAGADPTRATSTRWTSQVGRDVVRHLELVGTSLALAIVFGLPLGIVAARSRAVALGALAIAGLLQTVPSLALLAFLIPLLGIGVVPALVALFLYSLLPIVRNTMTGLSSIPPSLREAADAIGLTSGAKLWRVELPMASPSIMAGIKTSAVINVGTATLAALIGAEGLGNPIMQGIALRDTGLILRGAVPAALLALFVEAGFSLVDRWVIPRGLRLPSRPQ